MTSREAVERVEAKELHRIALEFEPQRTPRLKLIHPEGGCEAGTACANCGWSKGGDPDDRCEVCPDPDSDECWIEGWVDNYQADEVLAGAVEFAVIPECDGDALTLHVAAEPATVPEDQVEGLVEALEWIDGCFPVDGRRVTYGDPNATVDKIRARVNDALAAHRGTCRVCHGPLEGAPGPECDDTGCPERDGSGASFKAGKD